MFALEITFPDGVSQPETVYVRRPQSLIGSSDYAHVVVEDMNDLGLQLRLIREVGRKFRLKPSGSHEDPNLLRLLENSYESEASVDLGKIRFYVTALDTDLLLKDAEPPDRAGVRILRQACAYQAPLFPAVVVKGSPSMVVSFVPDQPIYIGRSKHCALRLDSADISAKHARLGYESGEFWVEDLGSTNGTFIDQQQISGRVNIPAGQPIILGREVTIVGVTSEDQLMRATKGGSDASRKSPAVERRYPVLLSVSEVARPARLIIPLGAAVTLGRDPSCDMWLGAPHVSRKHCSISCAKTGNLSVTDTSTNGTAHDGGILKKGDILEVGGTPTVLDFGGGVTVALCHDEGHEQQFTSALGSQWAFRGGPPAVAGAEPQYGGVPQQYEVSQTGSRHLPRAYELVQIFRQLRFPLKVLVLVVLFAFLVVCGVLLSLITGVFT